MPVKQTMWLQPRTNTAWYWFCVMLCLDLAMTSQLFRAYFQLPYVSLKVQFKLLLPFQKCDLRDSSESSDSYDSREVMRVLTVVKKVSARTETNIICFFFFGTVATILKCQKGIQVRPDFLSSKSITSSAAVKFCSFL